MLKDDPSHIRLKRPKIVHKSKLVLKNDFGKSFKDFGFRFGKDFVTAESVLSICWCSIGTGVVLLLTFCRSRHRDSLIHRLLCYNLFLCCSEIDTKLILLFDFCTDQGIETSVGHSVADHVEVCEQAHNGDA